MKRVLLGLIALVVALGALPAPLALADSNQLYVVKNEAQMSTGTSFTVNIKSYATAATPGTASGVVLYSPNQLDVTSISIGGSDYGSPSLSQGTGTINFNGTQTTPHSGLSQLFAITFTAKAAGTATVTFSSSSKVNNTTTNYSPGTYTITSPAPPPPSSTPPKSTAPAPSAAPSKAPIVTTPAETSSPTTATDTSSLATTDPTGVVDTVFVTPAFNYATVTWKVNAANPNASIIYGSSASLLNKSGNAVRGTGGNFSAKIDGLMPGGKYYFSITGTGSGNKSGTYGGIIQTEGYPVIITVTENGIAANNAQVQIGSESFTTHSDGKVTVGLAAGSYSGKITTNTATQNINLTVVAKTIPSETGTAPESQSFPFDLKSSPLEGGAGSGQTIFTFVAVLVGGSVLLVFGFLIFINIRKRRFESGSESYKSYSGPSVVIDDGFNWQQEAPAAPRATAPEPPSIPADYRSNSVHLSEAEPLDMFEQAKLHEIAPTSSSQASTEQTPNQPHSTTP